MGGDVRLGRDAPQYELRRDGVRELGGEIASDSQHLPGLGVEAENESPHNLGSDGVQIELEGGHHAQVPSAAAGGPEQLGVLVAAGGADVAVGGDALDRAQVAADQPSGPN